MKAINLNKLAKDVCEDEGGAVNQNIAQVKETLAKALDRMAKYTPAEVIATVQARKGCCWSKH